MHSFTDRADRTWNLVLNVSMAKQIKDRLEYDVLNLEQFNISKLFNDPYLLVNILWVICEKQTEKMKWVKKWIENGEEIKLEKVAVDQDEFGEGLAGETIDKATEALLNEISDFLPNHRLRKIFSQGLKKTEEAMDKIFNQMEKVLESPELMEKVTMEAQELINKEFLPGKSFGTTQES